MSLLIAGFFNDTNKLYYKASATKCLACAEDTKSSKVPTTRNFSDNLSQFRYLALEKHLFMKFMIVIKQKWRYF